MEAQACIDVLELIRSIDTKNVKILGECMIFVLVNCIIPKPFSADRAEFEGTNFFYEIQYKQNNYERHSLVKLLQKQRSTLSILNHFVFE